MFVGVHVDSNMRVVENFLSMVGFYFIDISPCGKFHMLQGWLLRFHMRTHHRPADLAEASHW